jgi:transcription initiation factor TFIID TATA-box-binding protein
MVKMMSSANILGKIVVLGAKSEYDSNLAARKFARMIEKLDYKVKLANFQV